MNDSPSGYGTNIGSYHLCPVHQPSSNPSTLEGPWSAVCDAIQKCHAAVHEQGAPRIATDIRIGTRVDRKPDVGKMNEKKVTRVQDILTDWSNTESH